MKFFVSALLAGSALAAPLALRPRAAGTASAQQIAQLAPDLGATPPLQPTGFGDCLGPVNGPDGQPAKVPCACPPTKADYITALTANVQAGHAVNNTGVAISFPTGDSVADKHARITAAAITLQNLVGPGKGCPLVSTTLGVQSKALDSGASTSTGADNAGGAPAPAPAPQASNKPAAPASVPAPAASAPASAPAPAASEPASSGSSTNGAPSAAQIAQLAPDLGAAPPLQPSGFGDCLGPVNGPDGQPAKVPCACPPTKADYIAALTANVQAGHAVNNTGVAISFPTSDSVADKHARITAAAITLQNLVGPGKGCPLVSTTLGVQSKALDA